MKPDSRKEAAVLLSTGRLALDKMGILPLSVRPSSEIDAYAVQDLLHREISDGGFGELVGHKIGCTTAVMQSFLDIDNPCSGGVFDSTVQYNSGTFKFNQLLHPGVECEIAVRLGVDLTMTGTPYDIDSVAPAVESVMPAIEVVDDRWVDYKSVDTPTLIADDFFGAGCVLGTPLKDWSIAELPKVKGSMFINDKPVGSGVGSDIMNHPFKALAWLANSMSERGRGLFAGEFVLLGSLVETKWVELGDVVTIEQVGLGTATAHFV